MPDNPPPPAATTHPVAPDSVAAAADVATRASGTTAAGQDAQPELPGYDIVREVSRGGMGVVYEARQRSLNRAVAIKLVLGGVRAEPVALSRFLNESRATAAVHHPHVVQVHDFGESAGRPYLVMEFCPGGTLAGRISGAMPPTAAAELVRKIAGGVAAAHVWGIVHRDLKPQNVLFDETGEPKVADFGLAKFATGATLTRPGDLMGTPAYMAPEQASGRATGIGPTADVWALGVILYECLTGTRPFTADLPVALLAAVQMAEPRPVRALAPAVPRDLEFVCMKCLRKNPADRYPTAAELAADLDRFLAGQPLAARDRGYRVRRVAARWWKPAALAAAVVGVVAVALWAVLAYQESQELAMRREEVLRRVEAVRAGRPNPDRTSPHPVVAVEALPEVDATAFAVISDDRVVDLREWKQLSTSPPGTQSFAVFQNRRLLAKRAAADEYRIEYRTTGRDVVARAVSPSPERAKVYTTAAPRVVGRQEMKVRQLAFDTSAVPLHDEFTAQVSATYIDSLQSPDDQWLGVIGSAGAVRSSILVVFPDDRPFATFSLRVAPPGGGAPGPYRGRVVNFTDPDRRWLYWEVPRPLDRHVYRVDWTW